MPVKTETISTGFIAKNINLLHKPGVLQEMRRLYLEEIEKFFTCDAQGRKILNKAYCVDVLCPICATEPRKSEKIIQISGFDHLRCPTCKNVYVSPRLKDEYIWEQYSRPSYTYMFKNLIEHSIDFRKNVIAYGKFKWVTKRLANPKARTLLDIGSGFGENLAVYKEHGWEVAGIEFNEYAAQRSRELFDVTVLNEPIEQANLPRDKYDVITMWGVLEHLTNPISVLKSILQHLADDGVLVFMVPHFNCLTTSYLQDYPEDATRHLDGDKHLVVYTREGVEYLAGKMQLEIVDIAYRGLDLVTILEYVEDEKETRLYKLIKKEISALQKGIEEIGFGDGLWAMLSKRHDKA